MRLTSVSFGDFAAGGVARILGDMDLEFWVEGLPPKKDGAQSMWDKPLEVQRLKALRVAALEALRLAALQAMTDAPGFPLEIPVELHLTVRAHPRDGDLDNFVTGVCDGLMAKHPRASWNCDAWAGVPEAATPELPLLFWDDALVDRITAERLAPELQGPSYRVRVAPIPRPEAGLPG